MKPVVSGFGIAGYDPLTLALGSFFRFAHMRRLQGVVGNVEVLVQNSTFTLAEIGVNLFDERSLVRIPTVTRAVKRLPGISLTSH